MEGIDSRKEGKPPMPTKYPQELRDRAVRLVKEAQRDPETAYGATTRVAQQLGVKPDTLRGWLKQADIDAGEWPGTSTTESARIAELEREVRELRRANDILKKASAFFAAELDRPSR